MSAFLVPKHIVNRVVTLIPSRPRLGPSGRFHRVRRGADRLQHATSGAVALEFALVGPVAIYLAMIGIGFSHLFLTSVLLHDALVESARYGATGSDNTGARIANITSMINSLSHVTPTVTITSYTSWSNLASGTPYTSSYGPPGGPNDVVLYSVTYTDPLVNSLLSVVPQLGKGGGNAPIATLSQSTIVQNEPNFTQ